MSIKSAVEKANETRDAGLERLRLSTLGAPAKEIIRQGLAELNQVVAGRLRALRQTVPAEELGAANMLFAELAAELVAAGRGIEAAEQQAKNTS
jgi:hypothetical protein